MRGVARGRGLLMVTRGCEAEPGCDPGGSDHGSSLIDNQAAVVPQDGDSGQGPAEPVAKCGVTICQHLTRLPRPGERPFCEGRTQSQGPREPVAESRTHEVCVLYPQAFAAAVFQLQHIPEGSILPSGWGSPGPCSTSKLRLADPSSCPES